MKEGLLPPRATYAEAVGESVRKEEVGADACPLSQRSEAGFFWTSGPRHRGPAKLLMAVLITVRRKRKERSLVCGPTPTFCSEIAFRVAIRRLTPDERRQIDEHVGKGPPPFDGWRCAPGRPANGMAHLRYFSSRLEPQTGQKREIPLGARIVAVATHATQ